MKNISRFIKESVKSLEAEVKDFGHPEKPFEGALLVDVWSEALDSLSDKDYRAHQIKSLDDLRDDLSMAYNLFTPALADVFDVECNEISQDKDLMASLVYLWSLVAAAKVVNESLLLDKLEVDANELIDNFESSSRIEALDLMKAYYLNFLRQELDLHVLQEEDAMVYGLSTLMAHMPFLGEVDLMPGFVYLIHPAVERAMGNLRDVYSRCF